LIVDLARKLEVGLGYLARLFYGLAAFGLILIVAIIVASVVMRRVADSPLYYTEELVGLLLSSTLFLALPMVTKKADHVRVVFLLSYLSERGRAILAVCAGAVMLAFCGWFLVEAIPWLEFAVTRGIKSEAASLRLAPWMAVPPVSIAVCGLLVLTRVITGSEEASFGSDRIEA